METPGPEVLGPYHQRIVEPGGQRLPRSLCNLEANGLAGLALCDRRPFLDLASGLDVRDFQPDEVTSAELAVDGEVEKREIADASCDFETHTDRPVVLRHERSFLSDDTTLVPC